SDAADAVRLLRRLGVRNIVMLTGDNEAAAEKAGRELGISSVFPQLLPGDKVEKVESLLADLEADGAGRGTLLFAGDGINDAPVLARADVGIAMGGLGADAAIESADVVIMTDEPSKIAAAVQVSRRTMRIVRENIVFSLAVKTGIMALGALGIANIWTAVFGDVGVMFLAILNAMRMMLPEKREPQNAGGEISMT
ncbi:MAG: HAD-IC family P-type ATPase, partial [Treponemataceae bacterium]|nr:HAD-IC family P-type ATPase [Treponemataceae bacterium]